MRPSTNDATAALEHWFVSNVSVYIPESVKNKWAEFRASFKKAEEEHLGDDKISRGVEKAGWGVEEAQQRNNTEASEYHHPLAFGKDGYLPVFL